MKDHPSQWISSGVSCRELTEQASDYLDNRLSLGREIRLGLHVASCVDCREYIKQIALVTETARCLPKPAPSAINRFNLRRHFALHFRRQPAV